MLSSANQPTGGPKIQDVRVTILGKMSHSRDKEEGGMLGPYLLDLLFPVTPIKT